MAGLGIHMIFGRHKNGIYQPYAEQIKQIDQKLGQVDKKVIFFEVGKVPPHPSFINSFNLSECIELQKMSQDLKDSMRKMISARLDIEYSYVTSNAYKDFDDEALQGISESNFSRALALFAANNDYHFIQERPPEESVFLVYIAEKITARIMSTWQKFTPINFQGMLLDAKRWYELIYRHCLLRDEAFANNLISLQNYYNAVAVVVRGIAHLGYFQRNLSEANFYKVGEAYFSDQLISDNVAPENLTECHVAQIIKELFFTFLLSNADVSEEKAFQATLALPDNFEGLESFFENHSAWQLEPDKVIGKLLEKERAV